MGSFVLCTAISAFILVVGIHGLPNGAPLSACSSRIPVGHLKRISENQFQDKNVFTIGSGCYVIYPGDEMRMWVDVVDQKDKAETYQGVMLMVLDEDDNPAGVFRAATANLKTIKCSDGSPNPGANTITHTSTVPKKVGLSVGTDYALWTAPACTPGQRFQIRATVARKFTEWQSNIVVNMICNPDFTNREDMYFARPPAPQLYCSASVGDWAVLPQGITTSFEGPLGGWRNLYGHPKYQFSLGKGRTPSSRTGPDAAQDGEKYMYYEASGKSEFDMAGLYSPYGLQGCFCFSFWCHMATDGEILFTLTSIGRVSRTLLATYEVTPNWRRVRMSINSEYPIILLFQVFRGSTFLADIGLDNIEVTKGRCEAIEGEPVPATHTLY